MITSKKQTKQAIARDKSRDKSTLTPDSNTGSNSLPPVTNHPQIESSIDNLSLLWDARGSEDIIDPLLNYLGIRFDDFIIENRKIGIVWHRTWCSPTGALYSQRDTSDGQVKCRLTISGQECSRVSNLSMLGFCRWAAKCLVNLKCSRIDLAVDDYSKSLDSVQVEQALIDGNYSGVRQGRVTRNHGTSAGGFTIYLGSRGSEKMIRIYDKCAESHGRLDCYRFEVEYKGDMADAVFRLLIEFPVDEEKYQLAIINHAVGAIEFIDKVDKNIGRNKRLEWWEAWLSRLKCTSIRVRVTRCITKISVKKNWIARSVSKALVMVQRAIGVDRFEHFLYQEMENAKTRINSMDELIMRDYRQNGYRCYASGTV